VREYVAVYGCIRALTTAVVAVTVAVGDTSGPSLRDGGSDQGCRRRPKTTYEIGTTPAELTSATAAAHNRFRSRIWLASRCLLSIGAGTRKAPSATAVMSHLRIRSLRSAHTPSDVAGWH